jgi:hypothetical protein
MRTRETLKEVILPYLTVIEEKCILYPIVNKQGYGDIQYKNQEKLNKHCLAHRVSYETFNNVVLTSEQIILHSCDVPNCINPNHLMLGTHQDNVQDKVNKGRQAKGKDNGRYTNGYTSKYNPIEKPKAEFHTLFRRSLNEKEARKLKLAVSNRGDKSLKKLSEELEVAYQTLRDLSCGRIYKDI